MFRIVIMNNKDLMDLLYINDKLSICLTELDDYTITNVIKINLQISTTYKFIY